MIRYLLLTFFFAASLMAQERSYVRFTPAMAKDTLELADAGALKYDINISYQNGTVSHISISGTIGLMNKYRLENPGPALTVFSADERKLELGIKANTTLEKTQPKKPNEVNYDIADFRYSGKGLSFSVKNVRKIIEKMPFRPLVFPLKEKVVVFKNDSGGQRAKDFSKTTLEFYFRPNDIRYVNVFDAGELILKIPYKELLSFSNK